MGVRANLITGMAIGGSIMFLLDPQSGNRRRALVRDKTVRWSNTTGRALRRTGQTLQAGYNKAEAAGRGAATLARRVAGKEEQPSDATVQARLRACIGRHSSHPGAVEVAVQNGCARFSGAILADEVREVLECASAVRGVMAVDNHLQVYSEPGNIPALQGEGHRPALRRWWERSPALRIATGATAAGVVAFLAGRKLIAQS